MRSRRSPHPEHLATSGVPIQIDPTTIPVVVQVTPLHDVASGVGKAEPYAFAPCITLAWVHKTFRGNSAQRFANNQAKGGLKFAVSTFQAALTAYYAHFNHLSTTAQVAAANGTVTNSSIVLNTTTIGVEGEIDWLPVHFFDLSGSFTLQDPKVDSVDTLTGSSAASIGGIRISRT
jgi:hypothetical protein